MEKLKNLFVFLKDWMNTCHFRGCAFLNLASEIPDIDHRIRQEVISHKDSLRDYIFSLVTELKKSDNSFENIDEKQIAEKIYVIFEGAIVASQNFAQDWPIDIAERILTENILKI